MHGTFNGIRLNRIISAGTQETENSTLTILRGLDPPVPQLLKELRKDAGFINPIGQRDRRRDPFLYRGRPLVPNYDRID